MATYSEKLKDPRWQKKRLEIMSRDGFKCCYCGDTKTELHVHHLRYCGEPWEADSGDLVTVCKHCHLVVESIIKSGCEPIKSIKLYYGLVVSAVCTSVKGEGELMISISIFEDEKFYYGFLITKQRFDQMAELFNITQ